MPWIPAIRRLLIGGLVVWGTVAAAQPTRYPRHPNLRIDVTLSAAVTPAKLVATSPVPSLSPDDTRVFVALPPDVIAPDVLARLARIDPAGVPAAQKADHLLAYATELGKHARHWRGRAGVATRRATAEPDATRKAIWDREAREAGANGKKHLLAAVKAYKTLVDDAAFATFPKLDVALYEYGSTLQDAGYMKEARAVYHALLKNLPTSNYVPSAYLAFAEYYFGAGQLADAEASYRMVLKFPKAPAYWYAMYKVGWIHLTLQRYQEALETLFQVSRGAQATPALAVAAKLDFVVAYAAIGKADKAGAAFQRVDSKLAREMQKSLAALYREQGKNDKAIFVYRELILATPTDPEVCAWQANVAHAMLTVGNGEDRVREIENLVKLHVALAANHQLPAPAARACRDRALAMSRELGRAYHSEAFKTLNADTMAHASRLYAAYLSVDDAEDHAATQVLAAETRWWLADREGNPRLRVERWEQTAAAFSAIVATSRDRATILEAAHAAVLAWQNALDLDPDPKALAGPLDLKPPNTPPVSGPLAARETQLIAAIEAYGRAVGDAKNPELGRMRFVEAALYRRAHQLDKAVPVLIALLATHRDGDRAELVALLALDALIELRRFDEMLALADTLAADRGFVTGKPELVRTLDYVRSRSMRAR